MDALPLLHQVADAYRKLKTLTVEATFIYENGDEDFGSRTQQRARFIYSAPNRTRCETYGRMGWLEVVDGQQLQRIQRFSRGGPVRYSNTPIDQLPGPPHFFSPDLPSSSDAMLFPGIADRMARAEIVREEEGCLVVSVTYEPGRFSEMMTALKPEVFWIDAQRRMVMRRQHEAALRLHVPDEGFSTRLTMAVRAIHVDEPLPENVFDFRPPEDALTEGTIVSGNPRGEGGGFSGSASARAGVKSLEHSHSNHWDEQTLVQQSYVRVREKELVFERRITFPDGDARIHVENRVSSGTAHAQCECDLTLE